MWANPTLEQKKGKKCLLWCIHQAQIWHKQGAVFLVVLRCSSCLMSAGLSKYLLHSLHSELPDSMKGSNAFSFLLPADLNQVLGILLSFILPFHGSLLPPKVLHSIKVRVKIGQMLFCFKGITLYLTQEGQDRVYFQRSCGGPRPVWYK